MSSEPSVGILLVNTGTPDAPTRDAVVRYLRNFLTDRRIVNIPPLFWKPLLNGIILRVRPAKTVRIYQHIWTPEGSPYMLHSQALEQALAQAFIAAGYANVRVRMAHRYGNPSMEAALRDFQQQNIARVVTLPLYPQQAFPTTHSVHDELTRKLTQLRYAPESRFIWDYYDDPGWVQAVADSIRPHLPDNLSETHLLFSFHSEPLKDVRRDDPYCHQVKQSVLAIGGALGLPEETFSWAYQSQFDDTRRWLGPFLHQRIDELKTRQIRDLRIICPGFAVDCTETLYDIKKQLRAEWKWDFPAERFDYIPCLNESSAHAQALMNIIKPQL
jgi:ferrochelatase